MSSAVSLYVGDDYRVPGSLQGRIAYAGMPSPNAYSLVHKREVGANYAYNLFYSVESRDISVAGVQIHVDSVTPEMIVLRVRQG